MKHPHHKDAELTKLRQELGVYLDSRSWVRLDGVEFLAGQDMTNRRREVWERDERRCVVCGQYVTFEQMELDHREGRSKGDNIENLQTMDHVHHRGPEGKHA